MHVFYTPEINSVSYLLPEDESKHCIKVLRLKQGDSVILIDGRGNYFTAVISSDHPKRCELVVTNVVKEYGKRNSCLQVAIAPTKNLDRLEWFAEKATEIGIERITPLVCSRSERKIVNTERLSKIVVAAIKQSQKAYLPEIDEPINFINFLKQEFDNYEKYIACCVGDNRKLISELSLTGKKCVFLVGPEGDFTDDEVKLAIKTGFIPVSLGQSRLRTETAALHICSAFELANTK